MRRSLLGGLLLVCALVAVLVLPRAWPGRMAGTAVAEPAPPPPALGDCLLSSPTGLGIGKPEQPFGTAFGACATAHFGEVFNVIAGSPQVPDLDQCGDPQAYFGNPSGYGEWTPLIRVGLVVLGPNEYQQAAGQRWAACVLVPTQLSGTPSEYTGTLKNSFITHHVPGVFGLCSNSPASQGMQPVTCGQPHWFEYLGIHNRTGVSHGAMQGATGSAETQASCQKLALDLIGSDLVSGGELNVRVSVMYQYGENGFDEIEMCGVGATGGRLLDGTLTGLDGRPVPWA